MIPLEMNWRPQHPFTLQCLSPWGSVPSDPDTCPRTDLVSDVLIQIDCVFSGIQNCWQWPWCGKNSIFICIGEKCDQNWLFGLNKTRWHPSDWRGVLPIDEAYQLMPVDSDRDTGLGSHHGHHWGGRSHNFQPIGLHLSWIYPCYGTGYIYQWLFKPHI